MRMLFRFALVIAGMVGTLSANELYKFDAGHSRIAFDVHHFLGTAAGKFKRFSGTIDLDRDHPERSSVSARIEVNSIDTGIRKRDDHLRGTEFFDVSKFPEITFKSRSVKQTGRQSGDVFGEFTMHGVTKPLVLHVKLLNESATDRSHWEVTTTPITRRDFGLLFNGTAEALSGIGQEVAIKIDVEAIRSK
jgi:polyisoprenoid-binding protein YceI